MDNDHFKIYELKIHRDPYVQILLGFKTFEMRFEDPDLPREIKRGDVLDLHEWDPDLKKYTGAHALVEVRDVARPSDFFGTEIIDPRYLVYSIRLLHPKVL